MDIVLMGAPGAGKGTQAEKLQEQGWQHISTGDVLRKEIASGSALGQKIAGIIDKGDLIPDDLMIDILERTVAGLQGRIIFDGFPRTVAQAQRLQDMLPRVGRSLGKAIMIALPEEEAVRRLSARRQCRLPGGKVHQIGPDFSLEDCHAQGGEVFARPDDAPESIRHRFAVYHQQTEPVISFYQQAGLYAEINGAQEAQAVFKDLSALLRG